MFSSSLPPCVVIHGLDEALAALRPGHEVILLSARGAALSAGCGWWRALITKARSRYPLTDAIDILDCADAPGAAMAALRLGQRRLVLDDTCPGFGAVVAAAATKGAVVLGRRPDLSSPRQLR